MLKEQFNMYNFAEDDLLDFLVGRTIERIILSEAQFILDFGDNLQITMSSDFSICYPSRNELIYQNGQGIHKKEIASLISHKINSYRILRSKNLELTMHNETILTLFGNIDNYECYTIRYKEELYII
ncbi:hypothetical protein LPTSP4_36600 [Leptospira ryugenii]|uniref:Uncharacterized protein n=1 Tax=Leptospira ryugenii TaxID=1917863 RepID=A0A2P2E5I0_9LEPT|nr:hypothetical protein [Leptospira ryugenii]GBF52122.1 hypothetical protein LPTSP4_36600 [Leptospira ryugenii]